MTKVVLIHWGDNEYVRLAQKQAMKYNDVELLLDVPVAKGVSLEIERWFILHEYMRFRGESRVLYIDSDVFLLKDVSNDFKDCDMAFSRTHCGHNMFVNNIDALADLCYYLEKERNNLYLIDKTRERLPSHIFPDTMGDMVLLNNFWHEPRFQDRVLKDTTEIRDNSIYDHNSNEPGISWAYDENKEAHPYRIFSSRAIRLNSIHCQGGAKEKMRIWAKTYLGL